MADVMEELEVLDDLFEQSWKARAFIAEGRADEVSLQVKTLMAQVEALQREIQHLRQLYEQLRPPEHRSWGDWNKIVLRTSSLDTPRGS